MSKIISAQTSAVAASKETEFEVKQGQIFTVYADENLAAGEEIEIMKAVDGNYRSVADAEDPINTTKKIITTAKTDRQVRGPFKGALRKGDTTQPVAVYIDS